MSSILSLPSRAVLVAGLVASTACGGGTEPRPVTGIRLVAGATGTDTVMAPRDQALVVEVRDSTGRLMPEATVRFEVSPSTDPSRPFERGTMVCAVTDPVCGEPGSVPSSTFIATTTSTGRASVQVRHATLAATSWIRVIVPELGARDSATFVTLPGNAAALRIPTRDMALVVGATVTLPDGFAAIDRFGNVRGTVPTAIVSSTANLPRVQRTLTAASVGRGFAVLEAAGLRDTIFVSVVPSGRLALAMGSTLVVAGFDGSQRRNYGGLSAVLQYGLHPRWSPDGSTIFVHSGTSEGRLHAVPVASGMVNAFPTSNSLAAQWYPSATADWVYFTGETTGGAFKVWRARYDGAELAEVPATTPDYGNYYRPAPSPSGTRLAVSVVGPGGIGIRVFDMPSGTAASPFIAGATAPRWSPDGQWVAFSSPGYGPIRVMRADGSGLRAVGTGNFGEWFDWTNDGAWLVASDGTGGVVLVRVTDGETMPLPWTVGMWQPAVAP